MGDVHNEFSGHATYLVQAGTLIGDVVLPPVPQDRAARELALVVHAQWRDEALVRGLAGAGQLPVRWVADWSVADHPRNVGAGVAGGLADLAAAFREMPGRRLVIIGEPGSGKTSLAILLTLELLRDRADRPVPVILLASSWDPAKEHFDVWLSRRIAEEYQGHGLSRRAIRELVRDRRVVPVLDGLDELPDSLLAGAVTGLNRALGDGSPVILTCRAAEYAAAVAGGSVLESAAVIRAQAVDAETAADYLRRTSQPRRLSQWEPVFSELDSRPRGRVAMALSSPLMLWLARTVYSRADDPAELLDAQRFPDVVTIERHLLDALVPAVFPSGPRSPDQPNPIRDWGPPRARRWLTFLARHMTRSHSREFAWWRLGGSGPVRLLDLPFFAAIYFGLRQLADLFVASYSAPDAYQLIEFVVGANVAVMIGVAGGMVLLVVQVWTEDLPRRPRPGRRRVLGVVVALAVLAVFASSVSWGTAAVVLGAGLPVVLVGGLGVPTRAARARGPRALLRAERATTALTASLAGLAVGTTTAWLLPTSGWTATFGIWLAGALSAAVVVVLVSPWSHWVRAKALLAVLNRLPWSVLTFLEDARRAGVLRQVGGVYQFRHADLQVRLASGEVTPGRFEQDELRVHSRGDVRLGAQDVVMSLLVGAIFLVQLADSWTDVRAWLTVGGLVAGIAVLAWGVKRLLSRRIELRLTAHVIESTVGRRTLSFPWDDIAEVGVREFESPVGKHGDFMLHVRPHPSVEVARWVRVNSAGWIALYPLDPDGTVPAELEQALVRFAGKRWKPLG